MNYFEHHIGDYAAATSHLTLLEDACYSRLLRRYYLEEEPLPADHRQLARLVCARTDEEKQALEDVLNEFFILEDGYYINKRADQEIARFREGSDEREERRLNEKERQRRHREERKALFEQLRAVGIVPPYDTPTATLRTMLASAPKVAAPESRSEPVTRMSQPVTRDATATQAPFPYPIPIPDIEEESSSIENSICVAPKSVEPEKALPPPQGNATQSRALELTILLRKRGASLQASNPHVQEWAKSGVSDATALQALEIAEQRRANQGNAQPINAGLLNAIIGDLGSPIQSPHRPTFTAKPTLNRQEALEASNRRVAEEWLAKRQAARGVHA
ncbi:YdaU family protein [Chitinimonas sp. PSY-7]|uniref:DUF1376 domain-containing protein n=1 Tax=Chitinimonas sp. PSY-7 TaxID=3459088 RepID=UPI00403FF300